MNDKTSKSRSLIPIERIERSILMIRGQKVMLDRDLAYLYGVPTKVLNQAVKRHKDRFPEDFMFQLTMEEAKLWWTNIRGDGLRSQIVTLKRGKHIKYRPYAFTEHGILMLSSVLNSERAIQVNIEIMRAFVRLQRILSSHADLARKLDELEKKYDAQFRVVFDAIRRLMAPKEPEPSKKRIGFYPVRDHRPCTMFM
ncbi:MAG: ORF6N domain-containing protein [Syntrophaceae bacterium]|nr:ORF6N domain-containing protein [Syntrophaceae bacterium]